jgi:acyl carrier protein
VNREEIYEKVTQKMTELFGLDAAAIKPESRFEELELTSLDAIDLIIELQQMTGRKVNEAGLRSVRTVDDLVTVVHAHVTGGEPPRTPPAP